MVVVKKLRKGMSSCGNELSSTLKRKIRVSCSRSLWMSGQKIFFYLVKCLRFYADAATLMQKLIEKANV